MEWQAIALSLRLAVAATAVLLAIGLPLAYWLAVSRWPGKIAVEAIVTLPLVLPPTVMGYYLLIALRPQSWLGKVYAVIFGGQLPFTFEGLLIGSVLFSLPFAVQPFLAAFLAVDRRYLEASWCLGSSGFRTFMKIALPLSFGGVAAGAVLAFAHTLGEFGVVLMIGGNLPGITRTASIAIFDDAQAFDYAAAGSTSLALLVISCAVVGVVHFLRRRKLWN